MNVVVRMQPRHASSSILDDHPSHVLQDQWCSMHGQACSSSKLFDSPLQIGQKREQQIYQLWGCGNHEALMPEHVQLICGSTWPASSTNEANSLEEFKVAPAH